MRRARHLFAVLAGIYVVTRILLAVLGIRFLVSYEWQHFHDLDLLRDRLWESLVYTHSFTPFLNLMVGVVLKVFTLEQAPAVYQAVNLVAGLGFTLCVGYLLEALHFDRRLTVAVVTLFICTPAFIYFENFLHYEFFTAALLALAVVLLQRGLVTRAGRWWFAFFLVCAFITYVRLTFHLAWVALMVVMALLYQARSWKDWASVRMIAAAAALPVLLVLAVYVKNQVLFGFFGASSRSGFTASLVTLHRLPQQTRQDLVRSNQIHPASAISVYAGADAYEQFLPSAQPTGIPVLDRVFRSGGQVNYNHALLLRAARVHMRDGQAYLRAHPGRYVQTVREGLVDYMRPSTRWHPHDPEGSPHAPHRAILGRWEDAFHTVMHRYPIEPFGIYLGLIPLGLYAVGVSLRRLWQRRLQGLPEEKLVLFMAGNAAFVPVVSCLATIGELERYRFIVEIFMWIVALWGGRCLLRRLRGGPQPV